MENILSFILALFLMMFCQNPADNCAYIDCGACGAHVSQWHYVSSVDHEPVAVCDSCFDLFNEEA